MAEEVFDPYRKWLGIPPSEQPPTHYRLLAIAEFEDDPDVIANAADRCMAHVRTFQSGAKAAHSQQLLNELSEARVCLLDPDKKEAYDEQLREEKSNVAGPPPTPAAGGEATSRVPTGVPVAVAARNEPAAQSGGVPSFSTRSTTSAVRSRARRKTSPVPIILGILAVLLLGIVLIVALSSGGSDDDRSESSKRSSAPSTTIPRKSPTTTASNPRRRIPRRESRPADSTPDDTPPDEPSTDTGERPPREEMGSRFGVGERRPRSVDEAVDRVQQALRQGLFSGAENLLKAAERVARTDAQRQRVAHWRQLQTHMQHFQWLLQAAVARLQPGAEFSLPGHSKPLVFERLESTDPVTLHFGGPRSRSFVLDELPPPLALAIVDSNPGEANPGEAPQRLLATATYVTLFSLGDQTETAARVTAARNAGLDVEALIAEFDLPSPEAAPPTVKPPAADQRLAVPDREALRTANGQLRARYGDAILAAKTPDDKARLTKTIYQAASETDDPALRYALMTEAIGLATDLINVKALLLIIDDLADDYQVDALDMKSLQLRKAAGDTTTDEQNQAVYDAAMELLATARSTDQYGVAYRLAAAASNAARRSRNFDAFRELEPELERLKAIDTELVRADQARTILDENPDDPAANTRLGRAECFLRDNYSGGLPLLAKGGDTALADAAQQDLAMPKEAAAQAALGELWLNLAKRKGGVIKPGMLRRAAYWYTRASDNLSGDALAAANASLAEIERLLAE